MSKASIEKTLKNLDETLIKAINENTLPGLAVGVVQDGKLIYSKGFGLASIKDNKPVTADTIFRIGSISKTFTAIGIMQLVEAGKLKLDDPINDHLTSYKVLHKDPNAPPVTIRHMLTHTSGIGELASLTDVFKPVGGLGAKPEEPELTLSEYYKGRITPELYPGEKWSYANHAFATLGQLIEDVSGMPFAQYMLEHVFTPLGMDKSDYLLSNRVMNEFAQGYEVKKGHFITVPYQRIIVAAAGSIFSSVNQMTKYAAALMNDGANENGRVLQPESLAAMFTSQFDLGSAEMGMGLAFVLAKYGSHRIIWHNGGWPGFVSALYVAPDDKLAVIVFTNSTSSAPDMIASDVLHQLLDVPDPVSLVPVPGLLESPHDWPKLSGYYGPKKGFNTNLRLWMGMGGELEVYVKDHNLALRSLIGGMAKGAVLYRGDPQNPMVYKLKGGKNVTTVTFISDEAGNITSLNMGTNVMFKRPLQESVKFRALAILGTIGGLITFLIGRKMLRKCCKK